MARNEVRVWRALGIISLEFVQGFLKWNFNRTGDPSCFSSLFQFPDRVTCGSLHEKRDNWGTQGRGLISLPDHCGPKIVHIPITAWCGTGPGSGNGFISPLSLCYFWTPSLSFCRFHFFFPQDSAPEIWLQENHGIIYPSLSDLTLTLLPSP